MVREMRSLDAGRCVVMGVDSVRVSGEGDGEVDGR